MRQMFALVSKQGTAMHETFLCEYCVGNPTFQTMVAARAGEDESGDDFMDVTGNDSSNCQACGWPHDDWKQR